MGSRRTKLEAQKKPEREEQRKSKQRRDIKALKRRSITGWKNRKSQFPKARFVIALFQSWNWIPTSRSHQ